MRRAVYFLVVLAAASTLLGQKKDDEKVDVRDVIIDSKCSVNQDPYLSIHHDYTTRWTTDTKDTFFIEFNPLSDSPCLTKKKRPVYHFFVFEGKPSAICYVNKNAKIKAYDYRISRFDFDDLHFEVCNDPVVVVNDGNRIYQHLSSLKGFRAQATAVAVDGCVPSGAPHLIDLGDNAWWTSSDKTKYTITFSGDSPCASDSAGTNPASSFTTDKDQGAGTISATCYLYAKATVGGYDYTVQGPNCKGKGTVQVVEPTK